MTSTTQALATTDSNVLSPPVKAKSKQQDEGFAQALATTVRVSRSAYVPKAEPYSLAKHGSHRVGGIELVPGAPGYDFDKALPYLKEIADRDNELANHLKRQGIADPLGEPVNPITMGLLTENQVPLEGLEEAKFKIQTFAQTNDDKTEETLETQPEKVEPMNESPVEVAQQGSSERPSQDALAETHLSVLSEISRESPPEEEIFSLSNLLATQEYLKQRTQQESEELLGAMGTTTS